MESIYTLLKNFCRLFHPHPPLAHPSQGLLKTPAPLHVAWTKTCPTEGHLRNSQVNITRRAGCDQSSGTRDLAWIKQWLRSAYYRKGIYKDQELDEIVTVVEQMNSKYPWCL